jgi:hypothetical protein
MSDPDTSRPQDKRKYIRLKGNFPVDFTIVRLQDDLLDLSWQRGSTSNVSKGGICLETDVLSESVIRYLNGKNLYLDLRVHIPSVGVVKAIAEVEWYEKMDDRENCYIIGLEFRSIVEEDLRLLLDKAQWLKSITRPL